MIEASGCVFLSKTTGKILMQQRSGNATHSFTWGFFGGKKEKQERPIETLYREIEEELGKVPTIIKVVPISKFTSANKRFVYNNFAAIVENEFIPTLNDESCGYAWIDIGCWPKPLHPGAKIQCKSNDFIEKLKTIHNNVDSL